MRPKWDEQARQWVWPDADTAPHADTPASDPSQASETSDDNTQPFDFAGMGKQIGQMLADRLDQHYEHRIAELRPSQEPEISISEESMPFTVDEEKALKDLLKTKSAPAAKPTPEEDDAAREAEYERIARLPISKIGQSERDFLREYSIRGLTELYGPQR